MLYIKEYNNTTVIENDIEEIVIDYLIHPLDNLPIFISKITVKKSINIYRRQDKTNVCKLINDPIDSGILVIS